MFGRVKLNSDRPAPPVADVPDGILQTSLLLEAVTAPELSVGPVSLAVGLQEFVLLEGLTAREADTLLRLAATLRAPTAGRIFHWGRNLFSLPRRALYPWRQLLAFVSPFQSLLPRLTILENITLSQALAANLTAAEAARQHQPLLEQLSLTQYLSSYPVGLPARAYHLALWARELVKQPRLILGVLAGQEELYGAPVLGPQLIPLLEDYHKNRRGAILLAGPFLDLARQIADRHLNWQDGRWREQPLPGRQDQPLLAYLNLL